MPTQSHVICATASCLRRVALRDCFRTVEAFGPPPSSDGAGELPAAKAFPYGRAGRSAARSRVQVRPLDADGELVPEGSGEVVRMKTTTGSTAMGFAEVSTMLWRERDALQLLLFKLVEEQLIVSSGRTRWLPQANEEIEFALEQLRGTEVLRAAETDAIADELGLPSPATLAQLEAAATEPWATLYGEHRRALLDLIAEVEQ